MPRFATRTATLAAAFCAFHSPLPAPVLQVAATADLDAQPNAEPGLRVTAGSSYCTVTDNCVSDGAANYGNLNPVGLVLDHFFRISRRCAAPHTSHGVFVLLPLSFAC